jgi:hypothetical protein
MVPWEMGGQDMAFNEGEVAAAMRRVDFKVLGSL